MTDNTNNNDENIHIGELFKQIFGFWKIYVPIGIVCLIGAIVFLLVTPKEYAMTSRIQLLSEKQGMMSELKMLKGSGLGGLLGGSSSGVNVEDEILLMLSRQNLITVIQENDLQLEILSKSGLKDQLLDVEESPVAFTFPPSFLDTLSKPITMSFKISNGEITKMKCKSALFETITLHNQTLPTTLQLPVGRIAITNNLPINGNYEVEITPLQKTYETLVKELYIDAIDKTSDIVELIYKSSNKLRSNKLLNSIMNQYNFYSKGVKMHDTNLNAEFVGNRLDSITMELAILEHKIENYKQSNKMPSPEAHASITYYGNKETERAILDTETRLRMLDYVIQYMENPANAFAAVPVIDGAGEKSIVLYNELLLERQRLLMSSEVNNPALILAEAQLKESHKMLLESVKSVRNNVQIGLDALYKTDTKLAKEVDKLPQQEREYIEMKRQQKIKETIYLFLMQKIQEKELANSPDDVAGRIVDKAYSSYKHVYPKGSIILILAFIIACMLSLIVIGIKIFVSNKK